MKAKILLLGKLPPPYIGPAIATRILLQSRLADEFHLLHVNTATHGEQEMIGKWSFSKMLANLRICVKLVRTVRSERPELALVPISQATDGFVKDSIFIWLCRIHGCKVLLQLRGSNIKNWLKAAWPLTRTYVGYVVRRTDGAIVLGNNLRQLFADYMAEQQIFVAPNGADYSFPSRSIRSDAGLVSVLTLSNLKRSKGVEDVVAAGALLNLKAPVPFEMHVVGSWSDELANRRCTEMVRQSSAPVTFHPPAYGDSKMQHLADADVFVFVPREPEGHPWVIVEALAAGLPIVATDKGAITESVLDGVNGFIVDAEHPDQIVEKLSLLLSDPELRVRMGQASRRRYEERFTESKMTDRYTAVFNTILGSSSGDSLVEVTRRDAA